MNLFTCKGTYMIDWVGRNMIPWSARGPAPMNHVKYLRASPAEMPFQKWYTAANTNYFELTDSVNPKSIRQLY